METESIEKLGFKQSNYDSRLFAIKVKPIERLYGAHKIDRSTVWMNHEPHSNRTLIFVQNGGRKLGDQPIIHHIFDGYIRRATDLDQLMNWLNIEKEENND